MFRFRLRGQQELQRLARDLRRASRKDLREELRDELQDANELVVKKLRAAFATAKIRGFRTGAKRRFDRRIPSKHPRARLAAAIEGQVRLTGSDPRAQIVLREDRVPVGMRPLIPYFTGKSRLRHPIMGIRTRWAGQRIEDVWWPTIQPQLKQYYRAANDAVDHVADKLERG